MHVPNCGKTIGNTRYVEWLINLPRWGVVWMPSCAVESVWNETIQGVLQSENVKAFMHRC